MTVNPHTNVGTLNGGLWGSETKTDVLVPSSATLSNSAGLGLRLRVEEDVRLLLERALRLDGQFGGHFCGCWMSQSPGIVVKVSMVEFEIGAANGRIGLAENWICEPY